MYCPKCGALLPEGANVCGSCGTPVRNIPLGNAPTETVPMGNVPTESVPTETIPTGNVPTESVPADSIPTEKIPTENISSADANSADWGGPAGSAASSSDQKNKKKPLLPVILIIAVLVVIIAAVVVIAGRPSKAEKWQEQYDLGQQYLLDQDYEQAIVAFTAAIEIDSSVPDAYVGRAEAYVCSSVEAGSSESLALALEDCNTAIELDETMADAWAGRGDVYTAFGTEDDLSAAIADYSTAIELDNTRAELYVSRGDAYAALGSAEMEANTDAVSGPADTGTDTENAAGSADTDTDTEDAAGTADTDTDTYTDAESGSADTDTDTEDAAGAADTETDEGDAAGTADADTGANTDLNADAQSNFSAALADYDSALALDNTLPEPHFKKAKIYIRLGEYGEAVDSCTKAVENGLDEESEVYLLRAEAFFNMGQDEIESAADDETQQEISDSAQEYLNSALDDYTTALTLDAESEDAYLGIAGIYILLEDYESAMEYLEQGAAALPNSTAIAQKMEELSALMEEQAALEEEQAFLELIREDYLDDLVELAQTFEEDVLACKPYDDTNILIANELSALLTEQEDALLFEVGDGNCLGIYHYGDGIYYGEMENDVRCGYGVWVTINRNDELVGYVGEWADDVPNGQGNLLIENTGDSVWGFIINFVDGVADGEGKEYWTYESDIYYFKFEVKDGIITSAENKGSNLMEGNSVEGWVQLSADSGVYYYYTVLVYSTRY